ncbi:BadF/BadG/BcrA/BcrD ATPase family protein [Antribacter gilvus]|uniref:BadF/BadG/BcrA/BcrD ATPase family protein n=1 Tax=Antribacter gilvus TaxID=2304675 RepID=UPI000F779056|nr:BadF/BadG/BcrA/BcrD ATPase family protein [Antribacter gilvus]
MVTDLCRHLVSGLAAARPRDPQIVAAAVGMRGMKALTTAKTLDVRALHEALAHELGTRRTAVASDAVTAHVGALGGLGGAVVAVGSGAVAVSNDTDGRWFLTDGLGHLAGDEGSGRWIGEQGLKAARRAHEGQKNGAHYSLVRAALHHFGPDEHWGALGQRTDQQSLLAGFARDVVTAARDGDPACQGILDDAARLLAGSLLAALDRGQVVPRVATTGKLMDLVPELRAEVLAHVLRARPDVAVQPTVGTPLDGALDLARRLAGDGDTVPPTSPYLNVRVGPTQDTETARALVPTGVDPATLRDVVETHDDTTAARTVPARAGTVWNVEVWTDDEWAESQKAGYAHQVAPPAGLRGTFRLAPGTVTVGRVTAGGEPGSSPDVACDDEGVSRRHCEILEDGDGLWVLDTGSRNGTFLAPPGQVPGAGRLPLGEKIPVADGASVFLGAWTRLDLRAELAS